MLKVSNIKPSKKSKELNMKMKTVTEPKQVPVVKAKKIIVKKEKEKKNTQKEIYLEDMLKYLQGGWRDELNVKELQAVKDLVKNIPKKTYSGFAKELFTNFSSAMVTMSSVFSLSQEKMTDHVIKALFLDTNESVVIKKDVCKYTLETLFKRLK